MRKIVRRAGITPWPRLFQNLRASRETESAAEYPIHVVTAWIGNGAAIAAKHYLQVREEDFDRAARGAAGTGAQPVQKAVQQLAVPTRTQKCDEPQASGAYGSLRNATMAFSSIQDTNMGAEGLEPPTSWV
jgi:hypothetical protein